MKCRTLATVLLWLGAAVVSTADADDDLGDVPARLHVPPDPGMSAARLRPGANTRQGFIDTVYVGHSYSNHWSNTDNFWNLYAGTCRPGTNDADNALWDWDHTTGWGPGTPANLDDSLEGWWPIRRTYYITGGITLPDASRPWWSLDYGNAVNYRLNAGGGGERTKGVVGVWHHDAGVNAGGGVTWTPIAGAKSAWCGLRQHGDLSALDPITRNAYNASSAEFASSFSGTPTATPSTGTLKNFPGYMSAWDQMLYRDVSITSGQPVSLSFRYRTRMSTQRDASATTCSGIFWGDPLSVTAGNFISATEAGAGLGGNAPVDSFMVFVGLPADPAAVTYSDGIVRPVFDPMRRWFSEVLRLFGAGSTCFELFSTAGSTDTLVAAPTVTATLSATQVDALIAAQGGGSSGTARLVFRVKTNKEYADDDTGLLGFTSRGWGAAQIDDVVVNGVVIGSFEGAETAGVPGTPDADSPIDNATSTTALQNWKSTGKPPAIYWHPRALSQLRWEDVCGPPGSPTRGCDMQGTVMSAGNYDDGESAGDRRFASDRERLDGMLSPTINFVTAGQAHYDVPNNMGIRWIDTQVLNEGDDMYVVGDVYTAGLNLYFKGNCWTYGSQSYPTTQPNGGKCWGEIRTSSVQFTDTEARCTKFMETLYYGGVLRTSNPDGVPDSLRLFLGKHQQCFRFGVSMACGTDDGAYFDNVALMFVVGCCVDYFGPALYSDLWYWWQDVFPFNEEAGLPGTAAFDTTTALIRNGYNSAPSVPMGQARFDVPGDTSLVNSYLGGSRRTDLVFRILPGPGNYQIATGRTFPPTASMNLLQVPTDQSQVAVPGDASFWGQYLADPGPYGTRGGHHGGLWWDHLTWNSAQCDTAERNNFPTTGFSTNRGGVIGNQWASIYHESDPKFVTLGIPKFRCFRMDTAASASQLNIRCDGTVPAWLNAVPRSRTGWDGTTTTREFTKIIPDGLLTPGSHVQYFYRHFVSTQPTHPALLPDTSQILQYAEGRNYDGHRWRAFSVLPDRWKDPAFGGDGMACMLVVDQADRLGEERAFISIADTIGLTSASKWGAHNGWHARGDADLWPDPIFGRVDPAIFVHGRNQQPGTVFDLLNVVGGESATSSAAGIGSRRSPRTAGSLLEGKWARVGPTDEMLRTYYRVVLLLTGQISPTIGPILNRESDDVGILRDFLKSSGGTPQPRALWVIGGNFVEAEALLGQAGSPHGAFLRDELGVELKGRSFQSQTGFTEPSVDLRSTSVTSPTGAAWGLANDCAASSNDVLAMSASVPEAVVANWYGSPMPLAASVFKPAGPERPWTVLVDGFRLQDLTSQGGLTGLGRHSFVHAVLTHALAGSMCGFSGPTVDAPGASPRAYLDAVALFGNPLRSGATNIRLSLSARDRALVRLYDVGGRCVRTLADRTFEAGEHDLRWDGTDDQGRRLARGVYFAQVRYPARGFEDARKIVLVK